MLILERLKISELVGMGSETGWGRHHAPQQPAFMAVSRSNAAGSLARRIGICARSIQRRPGSFVRIACGIASGEASGEKIKKGQFKTGKVRNRKATGASRSR